LDLVTVNGAVTQNVEALARNEPFSLQQKKQVFRNVGPTSTGSLQAAQFVDATKSAGAYFEMPEVSRGLAFGDIDNDGDLDMVIGNDSGPLRLLINQVGNKKHWIGLNVPVGARVAVTTSDGRTL